MALDQASLSEYWALLDEVNRLAQADLVSLWRMLDTDDKALLWEGLQAGVPEIVSLYRSTAADTAMLFYESTQGVAFSRADALAAGAVNRPKLEANLRWAVFNQGNTEVLGLVAGMVQKQVVDGSRAYALTGFTKAGTGWYRAARPGACNFCRMLATRAATDWGPYGSAEAATLAGRGRTSSPKSQPDGGKFHNNCSCIPVKASEYQIPDHVEEWTADYYAAVRSAESNSMPDILSQMRKVSGHNH